MTSRAKGGAMSILGRYGKYLLIFSILTSILLSTVGCQTATKTETTTPKKAEKEVEEPKVGDKAPLFVLKNQDQLNVRLKNFLGKKNVILVFYPLDFTPVWTGEMSEYREDYSRLQDLDTEVFGISVDSYASDKEFKKQLDLPFDLLSDWDRQVAREYGAFDERQKVATRKSFLIDKKGVIRFIQKSGLNEPRNHEDMIKAVEGLQGGEWNEILSKFISFISDNNFLFCCDSLARMSSFPGWKNQPNFQATLRPQMTHLPENGTYRG